MLHALLQYKYTSGVIVGFCFGYCVCKYLNSQDDRQEISKKQFLSLKNPREVFNAGKLTLPNGKKLLPMDLKYLDIFMKWKCSILLLDMGIFPNAQEITESVAIFRCLQKHLKHISFKEPDVLCLVVGDGSTPRTASLLCFHSRWKRIVAIDPGLVENPKYANIHHLEVQKEKIQDVQFSISGRKHVVIILPHAHVTPNMAMASLNITSKESTTISVIQMPCCDYEYHDRVCGLDPDEQYTDYCIGSTRRVVRVWRDVFEAALANASVCVDGRPAKTRNDYPQSSSLNRRGWKKQRKASKKN